MKKGKSAPFAVPEVAELDAGIGDKFIVSELIGSGGMGAVYKATQPGLERVVAIKILPAEAIESKDRFEEEAQVLARCTHPNIVSVYEYGETRDGVPFIVMEYVTGTDLETVVRNGGLRLRDAFSLIRQICDGLAYAHARGMVHLDVKPANILIGDDGSIKIVDFGLARMIGDIGSAPGGGTAHYVAPEVLGGQGVIDHRADIYSLGVVIYQLLTGAIPRGMAKKPSELDRDLDPQFDRITEFALKKNPEARYQSVAELEADLMETFFRLPEEVADPREREGSSLRRRLIYVFLSMFASQIVGSAFNIWYNRQYIIDRYFADDPGRFLTAVNLYNTFAYLPLASLWGYLVFSLLKLGPEDRRARVRVINLPWWALGIAAIGWFGAIPGLWFPLRDAGPGYAVDLTISIVIGAAMALTQGFLVVDLLSQRLLYRDFFTSTDHPWKTGGGFPLSLAGRGVFWTISAGLCPVIALFLLVSEDQRFFAGWVAFVCLVFGVVGSWLLAKLVVDPINELRSASQKVGRGDLTARVGFSRADELGVLGDEFNQMVQGLREREFIRNRFGRNQGGKAVGELLSRHGEIEAGTFDVVVVAVHLRDYEETRKGASPVSALELIEELERSFRLTVERRGGESLQCLCGMMTAVFGMRPGPREPVVEARAAAEAVLDDLNEIGRETGISAGVGIASGEVLAGTIYSGRQRELRVVGEVVSRALVHAREAGEGVNEGPEG